MTHRKWLFFLTLILLVCMVAQTVVFVASYDSLRRSSQSYAAGTVPWLGTWTNRLTLVVSPALPQTLKDFPALVHLSADCGTNHTNASSVFQTLGDSKYKIAITDSDGTTQLPVEIERWDTTSDIADLWVKVPKLSQGNPLYLYFDKTQPDNTAMVGDTGSPAAIKVWSSQFRFVDHLNTPQFLDSTGLHPVNVGAYGNPPWGTASAPTLQANGAYFNGQTDCLTVPDSDDFSATTTGQLTFTWVWIVTQTNFAHSAAASDGSEYINTNAKGGYPWEYSFTLGLNSPGYKDQEIAFYVHNSDGGAGDGGGIGVNGSKPIQVGDVIFLVGRIDTKAKQVNVAAYYPDGTFLTDTFNGYSITETNTAAPLTLGTAVNQWQMFAGGMDEVRIADTWQSDAETLAENLTYRDALFAYGNVEVNSTTPPPTTNVPPATVIPPVTVTPNPIVVTPSPLTITPPPATLTIGKKVTTITQDPIVVTPSPITVTPAPIVITPTVPPPATVTVTPPPVTITVTPPPTTPPPTTPPPTTPAPQLATFGLNTGDKTYTEAANRIDAVRVLNTAGSGYLTKLEMQFNQSSASGKVRMGVYTDNNGMPGNLLVDAGEAMVGTGWVSVSTPSVAVQANTYYWIAFTLSSPNTIEYVSAGAAGSHTAAFTGGGFTYGALPTSASWLTPWNTPYVVRATVNVSSSPPTIPPQTTPPPTTPSNGGQTMELFYYTSWGVPSGMASGRTTHAIWSSLHTDSNGGLLIDHGSMSDFQSNVNSWHAYGAKFIVDILANPAQDGLSPVVSAYLSGNSTPMNNLINNLLSWHTTYGIDGVCIDWETGESQQYMDTLLTRLGIGLAGHNMTLMFDAAYYRYDASLSVINQYVDYVMPMMYDIWGTTLPNGDVVVGGSPSVASYQDWVTICNFWLEDGFSKSKFIPLMGVPYQTTDVAIQKAQWAVQNQLGGMGVWQAYTSTPDLTEFNAVYNVLSTSMGGGTPSTQGTLNFTYTPDGAKLYINGVLVN